MSISKPLVCLLLISTLICGCSESDSATEGPQATSQAVQSKVSDDAAKGDIADTDEKHANKESAENKDATQEVASTAAQDELAAEESNTTQNSDEDQATPALVTTPRADSSVAGLQADQQSPPPEPRRVILMGTQSPLVVDLYLTLGGVSLDEVVSESAQKLIRNADNDEDGSTTWEELIGYGGMNEGGMTQMPRGRNRQMVIRSRDENSNGIVDEKEYVDYYNRDEAGFGWLVLRSMPRSEGNRFPSPLGRWLDTNRDEKLGPDEIASAAERIRLKDGNADHVLEASEFRQVSQNAPFNFNPQQQRVAEEEIPAILVNEATEWGNLLSRIERKYTFSAPLMPEDTSSWPSSFQELDEDQDGTIYEEELAIIADRPADLKVSYRLSDGQSEAEVLVESFNAGEPGISSGDGNQAALSAETKAGTFVFALPSDYLNENLVEQFKFGFAQFDQDDDEVLDEKEFGVVEQSFRVKFEEVDVDKDGEVTFDELKDGVYSTARTTTVRMEMWLMSQDDAVMTALDQNRDSRLDAHEIDTSAARLAGLDVDGDGNVQPSETDFGMFVVLRAASASRVALPPTPSSVTPIKKETIDAPNWFTATDSNRDGMISRDEFLGDLSLFDSLDSDQDQALSLTEATSKN